MNIFFREKDRGGIPLRALAGKSFHTGVKVLKREPLTHRGKKKKNQLYPFFNGLKKSSLKKRGGKNLYSSYGKGEQKTV